MKSIPARIAEELNIAGAPSPEGRRWLTGVVRHILGSPIYMGRGIANRQTRGIYHMRGPDRPVEAQLGKRELYQRRRPPTHAQRYASKLPRSAWSASGSSSRMRATSASWRTWS